MREEIDLFGSPEVLFGCRHLPAEATGAGVLVCLGFPFDAAVDDGAAPGWAGGWPVAAWPCSGSPTGAGGRPTAAPPR